MQLRKLLKVYLITALLLLATLAAVNWSSNLESKKISIAQDKANMVIHDTSRLLVLTQEYVLFREERAAQQWQSLHSGILESLQSATGDAFPLPAETVNDVKLLRNLFHQLVSVKPEDAALKGRYERLLVGQLMTRTQAIADSVKRWNDANTNNRKRIEQQNIFIDIFTPIVLLVILALLAFVVANRVLKPLSTLHRAVKAVAKGDLTVRSDTTTEDEFGVFSRTFDAMELLLNGQRGYR